MTEGDIQEKRRSNVWKWLVGCTGGLFLVALVCGGLAWAGWVWGKAKLANWFQQEMTEVIEESGLPPEQVDAMLADVDRLRLAFEEGRIEWGEIEELVEVLEGGPLIAMISTRAFEVHVLEPAELPEDEREAARRTLQRCSAGLQGGAISPLDVTDALHVTFGDGQADERWEDHWQTPDDVRATVLTLEQLADAAAIPDEPYQVDVAAEFRALVDDLVD